MKKLFVIMVVTLLVAGSQAPATQVAEWLFTEGSGTTAADSASGGSVSDTAYFSGGTTWDSGGNGVYFDGDGDTLSISDSADTSLDAGELSIEFRLNFDNVTGVQNMYVISKNSYNVVVMDNDSSGGTRAVRAFFMNSSNTIASYATTTTEVLNAGTWYDILVTRTAATDAIDIQVNGVSQSTNLSGGFTGALHSNSYTLKVGGHWNGGYETQATIDDIALYDSVVPEPVTLGLLAAGSLLALARRRR